MARFIDPASINMVDLEKGNFRQVPAGDYLCKIMSIEDDAQNERLEIVFDIAAGEFTDHFANDDFAIKNPWSHSITLYYSDDSSDKFGTQLNVLAESNPGFDVWAAWNGAAAGNPGSLSWFVGRLFGLSMKYATTDKDGQPLKYPRPDWRHAIMRPAQYVGAQAAQPQPQYQQQPQQQGSEVYALPF